MRFLLRPNGYISSRFSASEEWRDDPHTGIDFVSRFKGIQPAMYDGYVYKVVGKGNPNLQTYRNVHYTSETPEGPMEIAHVHCWDILVEQGDVVAQGQPIHTEGNTGSLVFVDGQKVSPNEKYSGKGAHLHASVRPLIKEKEIIKTEHYIRMSNGLPYIDTKGFYYRIKENNDITKGWVDFEQWLFQPDRSTLLRILEGVIKNLRELLMKKK